tara:strand:- start:52 stop:405 length:354 start_codon:yes stop_codon:yes gene_type:complete
VSDKDRGYLLEKKQCDSLLRESNIRLTLVRSHLHEHSDLEKKTRSDVLKVLCELYVSLEGLMDILRLAQAGPIQDHHGQEHYVLTEQEGTLLQSVFLPVILELKYRAEDYGLSLTIN